MYSNYSGGWLGICVIVPKKLQNAVMQELHPTHGMAEEGGKK